MAFWQKELGDKSYLQIHDLPGNYVTQHLDVNWLSLKLFLAATQWTASYRIRWNGFVVKDISCWAPLLCWIPLDNQIHLRNDK